MKTAKEIDKAIASLTAQALTTTDLVDRKVLLSMVLGLGWVTGTGEVVQRLLNGEKIADVRKSFHISKLGNPHVPPAAGLDH